MRPVRPLHRARGVRRRHGAARRAPRHSCCASRRRPSLRPPNICSAGCARVRHWHARIYLQGRQRADCLSVARPLRRRARRRSAFPRSTAGAPRGHWRSATRARAAPAPHPRRSRAPPRSPPRRRCATPLGPPFLAHPVPRVPLRPAPAARHSATAAGARVRRRDAATPGS